MLRERRRAANNKPNRRLDRKSSRGMIYENEELRLRTININAEVERGQSDIRKLRRENEHLRREIWALRDEYDRLDKLLTGANLNNNNNSNNNNNNSRPPSGGSNGTSSATGSSDGSASSDGESENSCDEHENGEKINETTDCETLDNNKNTQKSIIVNHNGVEHHNSAPHYSSLLKNRDNLHVNFDHLSIVSEETMTSTPNSPTSPNPEMLNELLSVRLLSPIDPISTLTPLNELQSVLPSLYHFENLSYETLGPSIDSNGQILKPPQLIAPNKLNLSSGARTKPVFFGPMRPSKSAESLQKPESPLYATIKKSQKLTMPTFQNGGNLEDLLKEISLNPVDVDDMDSTMQPDIVAIEGDKLDSKPVSPNNPRKHRSQINLVLNYNGTKSNEKLNSESSRASTSTSPTSIENPLENRTNKIGFEKFTNSEHIYSTVDTPPPKQSPPIFNSGPIGNGTSPTTPDKPFEKPPPIIDVKRKSRRVSLCFNGRKTVEAKKGRRASIDVVSIEKNLADFSSSTTPFQRRHSTNLNQHHNNHHSRKSSHDSIKILQVLQTGTKLNGIVEANATNLVTETTNGRRSLSRESTSSNVTQKSRKASQSSHGGKIPWCACWGSGCF